jgi:hypothetical protein
MDECGGSPIFARTNACQYLAYPASRCSKVRTVSTWSTHAMASCSPALSKNYRSAVPSAAACQLRRIPEGSGRRPRIGGKSAQYGERTARAGAFSRTEQAPIVPRPSTLTAPKRRPSSEPAAAPPALEPPAPAPPAVPEPAKVAAQHPWRQTNYATKARLAAAKADART